MILIDQIKNKSLVYLRIIISHFSGVVEIARANATTQNKSDSESRVTKAHLIEILMAKRQRVQSLYVSSHSVLISKL